MADDEKPKIVVESSPRPETKEGEDAYFLKGYREALESCSRHLRMPGSPSLIEDVPEAVFLVVEERDALQGFVNKDRGKFVGVVDRSLPMAFDLVGRIDNGKFESALQYLGKQPKEVQDIVKMLARMFRNSGWIDGDMSELLGVSLRYLVGADDD